MLTYLIAVLFDHGFRRFLNSFSQLVVADANDRRSTGRAKKYRINFRGLCKVKLGNKNRKEKNLPIKLEGEDAIYYSIFATYMNNKRRIVKVDADAAKSMFNHVGNEIIEGATDDNGKVEVVVSLNGSAYTNVQSAIAFIFIQCGIKRPDEITGGISLYCMGSKLIGFLPSDKFKPNSCFNCLPLRLDPMQ